MNPTKGNGQGVTSTLTAETYQNNETDFAILVMAGSVIVIASFVAIAPSGPEVTA